jgi:hypothetical protein
VSLDLRDCAFLGPAVPEPFARQDLEQYLLKANLLPKTLGTEGKALEAGWDIVQRKLTMLGEQGGSQRVANHVIEPLRERLGYATRERSDPIGTREGPEDGGWLLRANDKCLRAWAVDFGTDLDAPSRRGRAYRYSPTRVADRVLRATNERLGLLTDGDELRLLICDPAQRESQIVVRLDRTAGWRGQRSVPDSYRLVLALARPEALDLLGELTEQARLSQVQVTKQLRQQARSAVTEFVQELLDDPRNSSKLAEHDQDELARVLWSQALIVVYRLLFILKLESSPDPSQAFSFRSSSLWQNTYSPNTALAPVVRAVRDAGENTGQLLGQGLRALFRLFENGLRSSELRVTGLDGMLFGPGSAHLVEGLAWSERAVAGMLDQLLWTQRAQGAERRRVHYGALDVEDLGRVYEALIELEPGIAREPMCRLRRQKLEVVLPAAQGERYRPAAANDCEADAEEEEEEEEVDDDEPQSKHGMTRVVWMGAIACGQFFLRAGLGRKSTGAYYTPHPFVRFLVQATLGLQIDERSPRGDPKPSAILALKVLDPAMGSGHFLVEACRFLGEALYEACRSCDELASEHEAKAEGSKSERERTDHFERARELRVRVEELPDPNDELVAYLPSRVAETEEGGLSESKARALCRRLAAVHCLYGVDKNPLAVELAKVSLWLESHAEGLPLTFLDHRLLCGDSLTGPFFEHLLTYPGSGKSVEELHSRGVTEKLKSTLGDALRHVKALEASIGKDIADIEHKRAAKTRLDEALRPFTLLAQTWSGGVMLGPEVVDDLGYEQLLRAVASKRDTAPPRSARPATVRMAHEGQASTAYDLQFPEVFYPSGELEHRQGFDVVFGNPPWDKLLPADKEFFASFDLRVLDAPTKRERRMALEELSEDPQIASMHLAYVAKFREIERCVVRLYTAQEARINGRKTIGKLDAYRLFMERSVRLRRPRGLVGNVVPSGFHANEGATGLRRLYIHDVGLMQCLSFENKRRLFEIHRSFKFALVVAGRNQEQFQVGFYLEDPAILSSTGEGLLQYNRAFVEASGGEHLTFLELRSDKARDVAKACYTDARRFGGMRQQSGVNVGRELNMTDDAFRFTSALQSSTAGDPRDPIVAVRLRAEGYVPLHEGKTFHQYSDRWEASPRYLVALKDVADKPAWMEASRYYRLAFRAIAASTNERTVVAALLPPGCFFGNSGLAERTPSARSNATILSFEATMNSFPFDWLLRQKSAANVNLFILDGCPVPPSAFEEPMASLLAHSALRLSCNHSGYALLWREQVGAEWREQGKRHRWPVLDGEDERWAVRAAVDAAVASAYRLSRRQYEHVLSSFNHRSHPAAQATCLAAFDELQRIGLKSFAKRHDPYWDVPLIIDLAKPVIDLDVPAPRLAKTLAPPAAEPSRRRGASGHGVRSTKKRQASRVSKKRRAQGAK